MILHALLALLAVSTATSEEVSIGCFKYPDVLHGAIGEWGGIFGVDCREVCTANGTIYTYEYAQWRGGPGVDIYCVCTDSPPDANLISPHQQDCVPGFTSPGDVAVSADAPGWHEVGCFPVFVPQGNATFTDFFGCTNHCGNHQYSIQVYRADNPVIDCQCRDNDDPWSGMAPSLNCAQGDWRVYLNTAQPSAFVRRQQKQRLLLTQAATTGLCPQGLNACMVSKDPSSGFECINVEEELESCGGCMFQPADRDASSKVGSEQQGVNCLSLPGVPKAGVTCNHGQCEAYACEEGYTLVDGGCVVAVSSNR
ncbi:hypothetical protein IAU59_005625 [Kwoniella sp. CBS 9459]